MTDKERLEEIKNVYEDYKELQKKSDFKQADIALLYLSENHIDWLIQQAEKREYWMKQHRKRANELEDAYFKIQLIENQLHQAQAKAERYKQALEFYAEPENYCVTFEDDYEPILKD